MCSSKRRELGDNVGGHAGFLYPFLGGAKQYTKTGELVVEVANSIRAKAQEDAKLRAQVARDQSEPNRQHSARDRCMGCAKAAS